ncbi:F0F1 ATP synthase subunit B [Phaeobacter sp. CECT 5382]|nr:F0F1 ATP synthase subunit B [Phaeobacter sp. CECT 5382]
MEQTQNFAPVAFVIIILILALLSPFFYFRLRRAKKKELATAQKAEQDIAQLQEDCGARLSEARAEAERKAETAHAEHSKALERYAAIVDMEAVSVVRVFGTNGGLN